MQKFFIDLYRWFVYLFLKSIGYYNFDLKTKIQQNLYKILIGWILLIVVLIIYFVTLNQITALNRIVAENNNAQITVSYQAGWISGAIDGNNLFGLPSQFQFLNNQNDFLTTVNNLDPTTITVNELVSQFLLVATNLKLVLSFNLINLILWLIWNWRNLGIVWLKINIKPAIKFLVALELFLGFFYPFFTYFYFKKHQIQYVIIRTDQNFSTIFGSLTTNLKIGFIKKFNKLFLGKNNLSDFDFPIDNFDPNTFLKTEQLSFTYERSFANRFRKSKIIQPEKLILKKISCNLAQNKFTSILGANGSGKSTFLKSVINQNRHYLGNIFWGEKDLKNISLKKFAQNVSHIAQGHELITGIKVYDFVGYGRAPYLSLMSSLKDSDHEIIYQAMKKTSTLHLKDKFTSDLSGGQQQKVLIAMTIAQDTDTVVLDEPTTYLDIKNQIELLEMLKEMQNKDKKTIIAILHDINQAAQYSDEIILIKNGVIYDQGPPTQVINHKSLLEVFNVTADLTIHNNQVYISNVKSTLVEI
ncbi:ABC-type cobalamin/Fe3+-siderophores transport system ATPase subunit [Mycoplasmoides fastidiosum]|uniref:ABC-type cobalamin/Fe3+-siderophores transport system ATPase subunit n=1 Tax=Mycoplasmoides fastidiosum TaxID=92758 RepID=A0ABU0LYL0_9BACT|nr:ABC transporter ATP-binding protein [Mycoplasmoides fastidiosum]MDQ0513791.1 ABC-type cobalamin/Fe3+-siderophores transport system ATPase subunit [Mycoplasmoides fastidiosum]UUD37791.1 ABC transporter ATP-binding protein [Mycoplasmoides fastidiosum]